MTVPAWRQLRAGLLERITSGEYGPGVLIPSANELVSESGWSGNAVRRVVAGLRYEGWVVTSGGRGS